jgi:Cu+-exporting ATPase
MTSRHPDGPSSAPAAETGSTTMIDPVCGMRVPADGRHPLDHDGTPFVFCSAGCQT